jgi:hypothetical protein
LIHQINLFPYDESEELKYQLIKEKSAKWVTYMLIFSGKAFGKISLLAKPTPSQQLFYLSS